MIAATSHGIEENKRVAGFVQELQEAIHDNKSYLNEHLMKAGLEMYSSHKSYTSIGLGCGETDLLVELGRASGSLKGIYGAKITGGGSGGTVAFLTYGDRAAQTVSEIAAAYQAQTGLTPQIFTGGQSPGAMAFGSEELSGVGLAGI